MTVKSLRKQLAAAIAMTVVAAVALGSSTYAWFAINSEVTATGMSVKTTVSDNLFIADYDAAGGNKLTPAFAKIPKEDAFVTSAVLTAPSAATLLEPTSTVDGNTFFYNRTDNTTASGQRASALVNYVPYDDTDSITTDSYESDFEANYYAAGAVGYVDYAFALKAVNGSTDNKYINLKNLSLTYGDATDTISKAFRIALFIEPVEGTSGVVSTGANYSVTADVPGTAANLNSIKSMDGATYFTANKAVSAINAVAFVTGDSTPKLNNVTSVEIAPGKTMYYKVVVRVWLEGEDNTCNNTTFLNLKDNWSIDLKFAMENTAPTATADVAAAKYIAHAGVAKTAITGTSVTDPSFTIDGVDYYEITGATGYYLTSATTAYDGTQRVYTITEGRYVTDVTNTVELDD